MIDPEDGELPWTYKGWRLTWTTEVELDNRKRTHRAVHEDGRIEDIEWSPYSSPTRDEFERLVDLGFPGSKMSPEEVERLWGEAVGRLVEEGDDDA